MLRRKCNVQSIEAYENKSLLCVVPHLVPSNKVSNKRLWMKKEVLFTVDLATNKNWWIFHTNDMVLKNSKAT